MRSVRQRPRPTDGKHHHHKTPGGGGGGSGHDPQGFLQAVWKKYIMKLRPILIYQQLKSRLPRLGEHKRPHRHLQGPQENCFPVRGNPQIPYSTHCHLPRQIQIPSKPVLQPTGGVHGVN